MYTSKWTRVISFRIRPLYFSLMNEEVVQCRLAGVMWPCNSYVDALSWAVARISTCCKLSEHSYWEGWDCRDLWHEVAEKYTKGVPVFKYPLQFTTRLFKVWLATLLVFQKILYTVEYWSAHWIMTSDGCWKKQPSPYWAVLPLHLPWETEKNHEQSESGLSVFRPTFETVISNMYVLKQLETTREASG
jgi:hypothetical protein